MTTDRKTMPDVNQLRAMLAKVGQEHLLAFYEDLEAAEKAALAEQIAAIDLEQVPGWVDAYVKHKPKFELPAGVEPAAYFGADGVSGRAWDKAAARKKGEELIAGGKVAAFVVAGGQGTRLGYEGPKGCYPAGAVTGKSLFQFFAENLLGALDRYGVRVPWYVMTSPLNHEATVTFFREKDYFGLREEDVMFFPQGVMPSFDRATGRILLAGKGEVATNPDGHGGAIRGLHVSGALADMRKRGVEHVSYFQVDNPTVNILDAEFLGLHAGAGGSGSSGEMSSKMVKKTGPEEKVGVFCSVGGKTQVLEYSDLPETVQRERLADGSLKFIAGSIAIHAISVEFLERLATNPKFALLYHRADKKVPYVDQNTGEKVEPKEANGVKLERFVFDAIPLCGNSIVFETDRLEEFAPIKNATGVDSAESSKQLQTMRASKWLESAGMRVPRKADGSPDCVIELSPRTASRAEHLKGKKIPEIRAGAELAL